nr:putative Microtubule-associated protein [Naematelia aurantialba]
MSSPGHPELTFISYFAGQNEPPKMFSSPVPETETHHALNLPFHFDLGSPSFAQIRKDQTPGRSRMRSVEGNFASPAALSRNALPADHLRNLQSTLVATPKPFYALPTASTPVQIADPDVVPTWENNLDLTVLAGFDSPMKSSRISTPSVTHAAPSYLPYEGMDSNAALASGNSSQHMTPTQSPLIQSAPPTKRHRTLSGLGTPSGVHRSAKKIRQATYDASSLPLSPTAGRRTASLMTSQPLTRNLSTASSLLSAPSYAGQHERMVSNASMMSIMSAASSFESWAHHSPAAQLFAVPEHGLVQPQAMPELSHQPSPNLSNPVGSPLDTPSQPAHIFTTSPDVDQTSFPVHMGMLGTMYGGGPGSTSMTSVASFAGPGVYRQNTLSTVMETPDLDQSSMSMMPLAPVPSHGQFERMQYPAVPGMTSVQQSEPGDVAHWVQTSANPAATYAQPMSYGQASFAQVIPRHASGPMIQQSIQPPSFSRSISGPVFPRHRSQPMQGLQQLPPHLQRGGFFPPPQPSSAPATTTEFGNEVAAMQNWDYTEPAESSTSAQGALMQSPDTPRRQRHPRMATYMKPGPKPKPKTPRKNQRSQSSPEVPLAGPSNMPTTVDPSILSGPSRPRPDGTTHEEPEASINAVEGLISSGESKVESSTSSSVSKGKQQLNFGPELATVAAPSSLVVRLAGKPGQMYFDPNGGQQPQLTMDPPRAAGPAAEETGKGGLPKEFLSRLFASFTAIEPGPTGQPHQVKRFKCLIEGCDRVFPRKSAVSSHVQTHLDDKPFVCHVDDCNAAFVRQHDLRRHQRIHKGDKPFPCICGKGFARGDALMRHRQRGICAGAIVPGQNNEQ